MSLAVGRCTPTAGAPLSLGPVTETVPLSRQIWTVPNLLSIGRLVGVPIFLWLMAGDGSQLRQLTNSVGHSDTSWPIRPSSASVAVSSSRTSWAKR